MKQALVIKNPKWERFTDASGAFKSLDLKVGESAVLVQRGRSKERRNSSDNASGKVAKQLPDSAEALAADLHKAGKSQEEISKAVAAFKPSKVKAAALAGLLLLTSFATAFGQANLANYTVASIAKETTNSAAGNGIIGLNPYAEGLVQLTVKSTAATDDAVLTVTFDNSDNGTDWLLSQYSLTITTDGTNTVTTMAWITNTVGGKWLRVGTIENPATNAITIQRFTMSVR